MSAANDDEAPPWHAYDGCYGCRRGDALARKIVTPGDSAPPSLSTKEPQ